MNREEPKNLEEFIHERLLELPQREAPSDLAQNVLATIAARESRPWYRLPWSEWPRLFQGCFLAVLLGGTAGLAWLAQPIADSISIGAIAQRLSSVGWLPEICFSLLNSIFLVLRQLSWEWVAGAASICLLMYGACMAGSVALYRVAASARASRL
jgi:hypothetical protein